MYTAVIADASARFHRLLGYDPVLFSTGTDEHGLKIQQAAAIANQAPINFCNQISKSFHQAVDDCEISYTKFIRTTESHHKIVVEDFWVSIFSTLHHKLFTSLLQYSISKSRFLKCII